MNNDKQIDARIASPDKLRLERNPYPPFLPEAVIISISNDIIPELRWRVFDHVRQRHEWLIRKYGLTKANAAIQTEMPIIALLGWAESSGRVTLVRDWACMSVPEWLASLGLPASETVINRSMSLSSRLIGKLTWNELECFLLIKSSLFDVDGVKTECVVRLSADKEVPGRISPGLVADVARRGALHLSHTCMLLDSTVRQLTPFIRLDKVGTVKQLIDLRHRAFEKRFMSGFGELLLPVPFQDFVFEGAKFTALKTLRALRCLGRKPYRDCLSAEHFYTYAAGCFAGLWSFFELTKEERRALIQVGFSEKDGLFKLRNIEEPNKKGRRGRCDPRLYVLALRALAHLQAAAPEEVSGSERPYNDF